MSLRRRTVLTLAAVLAASLLPTLPMTTATAAPVTPAAVLLPAPVVTPSTLPAGSVATVTGNRCVPETSTRVYVSLLDGNGSFVSSVSIQPAADGTWRTAVTPPISSAPGTYVVTASCDQYGSQQAYRSRSITVTASTAAPWTGRAPALPNVPNGTLYDVDCSSASQCAAVGTVSRAGVTSMLIESWNGSTWSEVALSSPVPGDVYLGAVDCPTATRCVAVGDIGTDTGHHAVTAIMAGTSWTAALLAPPAGQNESSLSAVSCPTATVCLALGSTGALSEGSQFRAIAYRLQGTTWSLTAAPQPTSRNFGLNELSCVNVRTCVAIGSDTSSFPSRPIAEVFDGSVWNLSSLASVPSSSYPYLFDISCASAASCTAVGSMNVDGVDQPLVQVFAGSSWRVARVSADPTVGGGLRSVSCVSSTRCTAVGGTGRYQDDQPGRPVVATLAGGRWTSSVVDVATGSTPAVLSGVSCTTTCLAVGDSGNLPISASDATGAWSDVTVAPPAGYVGGEFDAVACSAADACTAGGWSYDPDRATTRPLVDRWNGSSWTQQTLPSLGNARISGVACPTSTSCVAVGRIDAADGNSSAPLVLQWKSGVWRQVTVRLRGGGVLGAVSCSSSTSCLAVGQTGQYGGDPIAVALNGTRWAVTPTPPVGDLDYVTLAGVSCVATGGCRVTGRGYSGGFGSSGIDLVWDGSTFVVGPVVAAAGGVSCTSATRCAALPGGGTDSGVYASVLTGSRWTLEPLPLTSNSNVEGITCRGTLSCVAVGSTVGGAAVVRRVGGTWRAEPVAPLVPGYGTLQAVACPTDNWCVAVGAQGAPTIVVSPAG